MKTKKRNISFRYNNKNIKLNVTPCNSLGKLRGLMFRQKEKAPALLFRFRKFQKARIHSLFVFFDFIAIWLDDEGNVVDKKIVKPFRLSITPKNEFKKLIEIPLNSKYKKEIRLLSE